jgi:ribonuclease HI
LVCSASLEPPIKNSTTNNKMKMTAAIRTLEALPPGLPATVHSDTRYVVKGMREWLLGWKRRGWRTVADERVKNQPLWEALDSLNSDHKITWEWIKGHAGHEQNERVDGLANTEAQKAAGVLV